MRRALTIACVAAMCISAYASERIVPITDVSPAESPVTNSGWVTLAERASGGDIFVSSSQDWTVTNVSRKPIMTVVESISIQFPGGYKTSGLERYELFFYSDLMKPDGTLSFSHPARTVGRARGYGEVSTGAKCEVRVVWVQFADGSTFGDSSQAAALIRDRRAALNRLHELRDLYLNSGAEAFLTGIHPRISSGSDAVDVYVGQLRSYYDQTKDVRAAYDKLNGWITTAESRGRLLN